MGVRREGGGGGGGGVSMGARPEKPSLTLRLRNAGSMLSASSCRGTGPTLVVKHTDQRNREEGHQPWASHEHRTRADPTRARPVRHGAHWWQSAKSQCCSHQESPQGSGSCTPGGQGSGTREQAQLGNCARKLAAPRSRQSLRVCAVAALMWRRLPQEKALV